MCDEDNKKPVETDGNQLAKREVNPQRVWNIVKDVSIVGLGGISVFLCWKIRSENRNGFERVCNLLMRDRK